MKRVIILSIGTATPTVVKAISEAFEVNQELLFKMLYNSPAIFLENAEASLSEKAFDLLTGLGLEVLVQNMEEIPPLPTEPVDIAVYINDPKKLTIVNKQLSIFLGCNENESLQLLLNEPSVVLGGVSLATAESLQKRIDAEVIASNPKLDLYTIEFTAETETDRTKLINLIRNQDLSIPLEETRWVRNLTYAQLNQFLTRHRSQSDIKIYNQSYSRYSILLNEFDLNEPAQTHFLIHEIGMPQEILGEIHANLPVLLDESLNFNLSQEKLTLYREAGLNCSEERIPFGKYLLSISNIEDYNKAEELLNMFYKDVKLNKDVKVWKAPIPLESILSRFLEKQLEYIGCEIEHEY